jgi:hypothetical protein
MTTTQPPMSARSRIDEYARTFDVTNTLVITVDAEPQTVRDALEHLDLAAPAARTLHALGATDRVALAPTLLAAAPGPQLVFGLVWRIAGPATTIDASRLPAFEAPGHVKVIWDLRVQPHALEGALLSTTRRFTATDDATRERLLAGWGIIGSVAHSLSQRTLTAIKRYAEDDDELGRAPRPLSIRPHARSTQNMRSAA